MKRASASEPQAAKRARTEEHDSIQDPFDHSLQRKARELAKNGPQVRGSNDVGFISGKAFMVWPLRSSLSLHLQMETQDDGEILRFDIKFSGRCAKALGRLGITSGDWFAISLRGVDIVIKKGESSKPFYFPLELNFNDGVVFKFTHRVRRTDDIEVVIDTWKLEQEQKEKESKERDHDWFNKPAVELSRDRLITDLTMDPEALGSPHHEDPTKTSTVTNNVLTSELRQSVVPKALGSPRQEDPSKTSAVADNVLTSKLRKSVVPKPLGSRDHKEPIDTSITANKVLTSELRKSVVPRPASPTSGKSASRENINPSRNGGHQPSKSVAQQPDPPIPAPLPSMHPVPSRLSHSERADSHVKQPVPQNEPDLASAIGDEQRPRLNAKRRKREERKQKRREQQVAAGADQNPAQIHTADVMNEEPRVDPVIRRSPSPQAPTSIAPLPASATAVASSSKDSGVSSRDPALDIEEAFRNESGELYWTLRDLKADAPHLNVMGVVTSVREIKRTPRNDLSCNMTLVDPSNFNYDNILGSAEGEGCKLNGFTAKYESWLPSPKIGDVLIARRVKVSNFNNSINLVGYKGKFHWAIYSGDAGLFHHGDKKGAPDSEVLADGFGYEFSPFWTPTAMERIRCLRLADWWRAALNVIDSKKAQIHQVGGGDGYPSYSARNRVVRVHRLISDASPNAPPKGYFDCTVEIIHTHRNDNGVYSVYVTDYTHNPAITPVQASWCPPELADRVFKIEFWDAAIMLAQTMEKGDYWFLRNVRMRVSLGEYLEGNMQQVEKVRKLEESEVSNELHLVALLQRKREWEQLDHTLGGGFEHQLIENVSKQFFDCTVEVIHTEFNPRDQSFIYITDYTRHPDLPVFATPWTRGLDRRVVKVLLFDEQSTMAKTVVPGGYYCIRKLRMVKSATSQEFYGRLGGAERLIHKLTGQTNNEKFNDLRQRKDAWTHNMNLENKVSELQNITLLPPQGYNAIGEILGNKKYPSTFRLISRIVDFYPLKPEEFVELRCSSCQEELPVNRKQCLKCNEMDESGVVYSYCFFFRLEDEAGQQMIVSVGGEGCALLRDLEPSDLHEDLKSLQELNRRLKPFIGNLLEVHDGLLRGELIPVNTPTLAMGIDSWEAEGHTVMHGLMSIERAA